MIKTDLHFLLKINFRLDFDLFVFIKIPDFTLFNDCVNYKRLLWFFLTFCTLIDLRNCYYMTIWLFACNYLWFQITGSISLSLSSLLPPSPTSTNHQVAQNVCILQKLILLISQPKFQLAEVSVLLDFFDILIQIYIFCTLGRKVQGMSFDFVFWIILILLHQIHLIIFRIAPWNTPQSIFVPDWLKKITLSHGVLGSVCIDFCLDLSNFFKNAARWLAVMLISLRWLLIRVLTNIFPHYFTTRISFWWIVVKISFCLVRRVFFMAIRLQAIVQYYLTLLSEALSNVKDIFFILLFKVRITLLWI